MSQKVYLKGRKEVIRPMIPLLLSMNQMLRDKDIGHWVGNPLEDDLKSRRTSPLSLRIVYYSVQNPPWKSADATKRLIRAAYSISSVKRSMITWEKIKEVMGGANGYDWGRWRITQDLDNGSQMQLYAGTKAEAVARLTAFMTLTEAKPLRPYTTTEEEKPTIVMPNAKPFKETTRVYPATFTIVNRENLLVQSSTNLGKSSKRKQLIIPVWMPKKTPQIDEMIADALKPIAGTVSDVT